MRKAYAFCILLTVVVCTAATSGAAAQTASFRARVTVDAGDSDRADTPVYADVTVPSALAKAELSSLRAHLLPADRAQPVLGQVERIQGDGNTLRVWWLLPACKAGEQPSFTLVIAPADRMPVPRFAWQDEPDDHLDLLFEGRPVVRYMYGFDPEDLENTKKTFHHVFSSDGERLLTKGPGGKYPHHRGIFIGWNKTEYDGKRNDFWHCTGGVHSRHDGFVENAAGPVLARSVMRVSWNDAEGVPVVAEQRELTVFRQPGPFSLIEFVSTLRSRRGIVQLNGDMHHSGIQFRADNEVSERESETSYVFPTDAMKTAELPKEPWAAMSFALGDGRYTVSQMNYTDNPAETTYSDTERKYGRFGAFFTHELKPGEPLTVKYRFLVHQGQEPPTPELLHARYLDFIRPPRVTVATAG
jgi:hypothetical protein